MLGGKGELARWNARGDRIDKNASWLHTAAVQGDALSQSLYANVLYSGEWVPVDRAEY
jgi:hypothetical protein